MAIRRATPLTFRPRGLSDAVDGSHAFPGAMKQLVDLVPDTRQNFSFVCRPAAQEVGNFAGFATPGFVSGMLVVGDLCYGLVASGLNGGRDEPFVYNLATDSYITVAGITAGNTPTSPAISGEWTPPKLAVVGSRVIVCHPGFAGGATKFGWFDISGFSLVATGDLTSGSATVNGNPSVLGIQPGMTVSGTNVPAGATVLATSNFALTTTGNTHGTTTIDNLASTTGVAVGQLVAGVGIPIGATVATIVGPTSITISAAATSSGTGIAVGFAGTTITLSANATGTSTGTALTIAGGTTAAPLWGAGDTDRNALPSVPVDVAQMNGRAYYALGTNGIVYSDSLLPCRVSNTLAVQALTTNDGVAVTAIAPLMLSAPLVTTGIVQALIAFQGFERMQQITGDQTTGNLSMNALPVATGCLSSLAVAPCEVGTAFVSPEGLRTIQFNGQVSQPIGDAGAGVTVPFINSAVPSRVVLAANAHTIRATTQNAAVEGDPWQEYWYDLGRQVWVGPMSFSPSLIQPWRNTFLVAPQQVEASLWQADVLPTVLSSYTENGVAMTWAMEPTPLPDTGMMAENALVEMTFACAMAADSVITLVASDLNGDLLDTTTIDPSGTVSLYGIAIYGQSLYGGSATPYQQRAVDWNVPLVFKQLDLVLTGDSSFSVRLGSLYMKYEILGYKLQAVA